MKEVKVGRNDSGQRIDRFLRKYLSKAPRSFIYKMLRKKNIELNNKKAKPDQVLKEGDMIQLFLADETIEKFVEKKDIIKPSMKLDIVYEDENILLINKPKGILSHEADIDEENIVNNIIGYLTKKGDYDPNKEKTFTPAICNRLDRNTSGIIIGAKNYTALKDINEAMRKGNIKKYYKAMVVGNVNEEIRLEDYLIKDKSTNKVVIVDKETENAKKIRTYIRPIISRKDYSLLEIDLITGRTHQIRAHLSSINYPIVGDIKYGNKGTNDYFKKKFNLDNQFLHGYKIVFHNLVGKLEYLNDKEFIAPLNNTLKKIKESYFN